MDKLTPKQLEKYKKTSIPDLIARAQKRFNKFIRERDKGKPCISCGKTNGTLQAGHYYKVNIASIRFDEDNVHGECEYCNGFDIDHLIGYRKGLVKRYGEDFVKILDIKYDAYKRDGYKWDRFALIDIIQKYEAYK